MNVFDLIVFGAISNAFARADIAWKREEELRRQEAERQAACMYPGYIIKVEFYTKTRHLRKTRINKRRLKYEN